ncbi:MAG: DUF4445 domain-containing protein [Anaerolineales bacterium]|nr:DUF4445 domain-containing protein [Anaerolineales bacterium]
MTEPSATENGIEVYLQPIGRRILIPPGQNLLDAAREAGVELMSLCGGEGLCDSCHIRVVEGELSPITQAERNFFSETELQDGHRLACQAIPLNNVKIDVPSQSLTTPQRLQLEGIEAEVDLNPPVIGVDVHVTPPTLEDLRSDATRLEDAIQEVDSLPMIGHRTLRVLPHILRENEWSLRAVLRESEVVGFLPSETKLYGLAVDVGTTKLAAYLVDIAQGETVAKIGDMNPQIAYGEDVVSRIAYVNKHADGGHTLQSKLIEVLNGMMGDLCSQAGVTQDQILEVVVVGNTVMHHLFAGFPVRQLGESPYVPVLTEPVEIQAAYLDLKVAPGAYVYLPPNIAGYVGADHVAMLISTRVWETDQTTLAVDIGTNTEITLATGGRLLSCSCASGPAFEGAHIRDGMRAAPGAIERVQFLNGEAHLQTIGNIPPVGICGSGILDAVAGMLTEGLLDQRGVLQGDDPRFLKVDDKGAFILSPAAQNGHDRDILVTRSDVNEIQLAKGAIRTGIDILLMEGGIPLDSVDRLIIAGAFGTYIDIESAINVSMFPDLPRDRFEQVGNAAGAGARDLLISTTLRQKAEEIARKVEYVELTTHPEFTRSYMERLYFNQ